MVNVPIPSDRKPCFRLIVFLTFLFVGSTLFGCGHSRPVIREIYPVTVTGTYNGGALSIKTQRFSSP
jgi:hypothetical protein